MLQTELIEIPKGEEWMLIQNTTDAFDIQNTSEVMIEFTYTIPMKQGSYLLPNTWLLGLQQDVYVRHKNGKTNGTISVVRFTANV